MKWRGRRQSKNVEDKRGDRQTRNPISRAVETIGQGWSNNLKMMRYGTVNPSGGTQRLKAGDRMIEGMKRNAEEARKRDANRTRSTAQASANKDTQPRPKPKPRAQSRDPEEGYR